MDISRFHILMFGVVGIFTGMIAPGAVGTEGGDALPYAMTNMQYMSYCILIVLVLLFLCASLHWRRLSNFLSYILILLVAGLFILTLGGAVQSFAGHMLNILSWGWIFLGMGGLFLFAGISQREEKIPSHFRSWYDLVIGIVGTITLTLLTMFIVYVSHINQSQHQADTVIAGVFGSGNILSSSGITQSPAFSGITLYHFDRKSDTILFHGRGTSPHESPYMPTNPETAMILGNQEFWINTDGIISQSGQTLGKMASKKSDEYIAYGSGETLFLITTNQQRSFSGWTPDADMVNFTLSSGDVYWRGNTATGQLIYKNGLPFSGVYPRIHQYAISMHDGHSLLAVENPRWGDSIIKDGGFAHDLRTNRIPGTLQMNGNYFTYIIRNDDESLSLVVDGSILDRKLDEIREVFLDKNSNGFVYFGRPQGELRYCIFTRFKGNLCGFDAYMNPMREGDGVGVVFAGLRDGAWRIYRNTNDIIRETNYTQITDFSHDYFFFDPTNPQYYVFITRVGEYYQINKQGKILPQLWNDIDITSVNFGYRGKVILSVQDQEGWRLIEI